MEGELSKEKILCMYSGGLDSLGVLYQLLHDAEYSNYDIHVHHLVLKNLERRAVAEQKAVKTTLKYFEQNEYRKFFYTESLHDYSFMRKYFIYDTFWYAFMAANIMIADPHIKSVAVGRTKDDSQSEGSMKNAWRGHEIFHATLPLHLRFERKYIYPVRDLSKAEVWDMLPGDLRELSWSCRRPIYKQDQIIACQKCNTCLEIQKIKDRGELHDA